jgi:hypothetical protein
MPLVNLTEEEKAVIFDCLKCVASGKVILHNWEFTTIFGIEVPEFLVIVDRWPNVDDSEVSVFLAINNTMNNLLGYPHGQDLSEYIRAPRSEITRVFQK